MPTVELACFADLYSVKSIIAENMEHVIPMALWRQRNLSRANIP